MVAPTAVANDLAAMCVLRQHRSNHRACLDPGIPLHTPEVVTELNPEIKNLNTSFNESFNAWLDNLVPDVRHMTPTTLQVCTLLVAHLWNQWVIRPGQTEVRTHAPRHRLKRYRMSHRGCLVCGKVCVLHDTLHHRCPCRSLFLSVPKSAPPCLSVIIFSPQPFRVKTLVSCSPKCWPTTSGAARIESVELNVTD